MNTTEKTLLVILAAALALFLVLAIISIVLVIRVLKSVNRVTAKAEKVLGSAENVGQIFKHTAEQMTFFRLIRNVAEMVSQHHNAKKGE